MSTLPSQHSENADQDIWRYHQKLAELLATKFNLQSITNYIVELFRQVYSVRTSLWLAPEVCARFTEIDRSPCRSLNDQPSPLMAQAAQAVKVISGDVNRSPGTAQGVGLGVPLLAGGQLLGAAQLAIDPATQNSEHDIAAMVDLLSQYALAVSCLLACTKEQYLQHCSEMLDVSINLSRSILSDLDRDSLINNCLSLIYQQYDFLQVNLVLSRGSDSSTVQAARYI